MASHKLQNIQLWPNDLAKLVGDALQNAGFSELAEKAKKDLYGPDVMVKLPTTGQTRSPNRLAPAYLKHGDETFFARSSSPVFDSKCSTKLNLLEFTNMEQSAILSDTFFAIPHKVMRNEESVMQKDLILFDSICQPHDQSKPTDDQSFVPGRRRRTRRI